MVGHGHGGRARHLAALASALVAVALCVGCSGPADTLARLVGSGVTGEKYVSSRQQACLDAVDALVAALEEGDRDGVIGLFSPNARASSEDLDATAAKLVEACSGPVGYVDRDSAARPVERESVDDRMRRVELEFDFLMTCGGRNFWCLVTLVTEDDADEGEVGVSSLAIFSEDFYSAMIYDEPQTEYSQDLGLCLYLDYPLEWETRVVGGDPLRYDATGSTLDVEDAVSFLDEGGRSVRDFEERFGRPCCVSWMGEGHVCYELPSEGGEPRYLSLDASGRDEPVYSASVVGEHDVVERVWSEDGEA